MIERIAGYRVIESLGRGGMGVVYLAEQVALGREVALKVIAPELAEDEDFRERFKRESRLAASIDHPNVITVHEAGEADGVLFLAMRYVAGEDLRKLIRREGALDPPRAAGLVAQVGGALDAAHAAGLVHRDVKPANVLVSRGVEGEHAYLSDFGLTKHVTSAGGLTRTGQWVGTLDYVSPEQVDGRPVDARSDVYALGCVLYETLTGRVPFPRDSDLAKLYAHAQQTPPPLSSVRPGLPPALEDVVLGALAKDPDERPQSAGDLGREACAAAEGLAAPTLRGSVAAGAAAPATVSAGSVPVTTAAPPAAGPARRRRRDSPWAIAVVVAVVALAVVAVVVLASGGKSRHPASNHPAGATAGPKGASGAGFVPHLAQTYTAVRPAGWTTINNDKPHDGLRTSEWHKGDRVLIIETTPNRSENPLTSVNRIEREISNGPGYRRIAIRPVTVGPDPAASWFFQLQGERKLDIVFNHGGTGYSVVGSSLAGDFRGMPLIVRRVADSIQPR
jgi:hypothetical protein